MYNKIREIIDNTYLASIATNTDRGIWVSDVIHISDDINQALYWVSDPEAKHSQAIDKNISAEIAISITLSKEPADKKLGVQMQGFAHQVEGDTYDLIYKLWEKRGLIPPSKEEDVLQGDKWYVFYPTLIEIFDEDKEEKQKIELLDRKNIKKLQQKLDNDGRPYSFLWYDRPNYEYSEHQHIKPVSFYVLKGSVTFTLEDGSKFKISESERCDEIIGTKHSAKVSDVGCVYLTGQIDTKDTFVNI